MNSDYCSKEKKTAQLAKGKKTDAVFQRAGEDEMLEKSSDETDIAFQDAKADMIEAAGGLSAWCKLPQNERTLQTAMMVKKALISLGECKYSLHTRISTI